MHCFSNAVQKLVAILLALTVGWVAAAATCVGLQSINCTPCQLNQKVLTLANGPIFEDALDENLTYALRLLLGDVADVNGQFLIDEGASPTNIWFDGDGIVDVPVQMEALYRIKSDDTARYPAGSILSTADVQAALTANVATLRTKIGDPNALALIDLASPQLIPLLAYTCMLGASSDYVVIAEEPNRTITGQGALGTVQAMMTLMEGFEVNNMPVEIVDPVIRPGDFITFGNLLEPKADLDNDGYSNACEYRHFERPLCNASFPNAVTPVDDSVDCVTAMLDPEIHPVGCYEEVGESCDVELLGASAVPPSETAATGATQFSVYENTETGDRQYRLKLRHDLRTPGTSLHIALGNAGVFGEVIFNLPDASPTYWELFLDPVKGEQILSGQAYLQIDGNDGEAGPVIESIRGDNIGCYVVEGLEDGEGSEEPQEGEGQVEGQEGSIEGVIEGEGLVEGEGVTEGEGATEGEGVIDGEGVAEGDGASEGEGIAEGDGGAEGEGLTDGATDGEGAAETTHSADSNHDQQLQLTELLVIIQLYNAEGFGCASGESGAYVIGSSEHDCSAHTSDYNPQDWLIELSELLRALQYFNSGGYVPCEASEDGYCAVAPLG